MNWYKFDKETYEFHVLPQMEELGEQRLKLKLTDKYNKSIEQAFNILVLLSPCETTDSTQHTIKIK